MGINIQQLTNLYQLNRSFAELGLAQSQLVTKFVSFHRSLIASSKFPVIFLARYLENDLRSVHGQNLCNIALLCGLDGTSDRDRLKSTIVKRKVRYTNTPLGDEWKVNLSKELLDIRDDDDLTLPWFSSDELMCILDHVCVL